MVCWIPASWFETEDVHNNFEMGGWIWKILILLFVMVVWWSKG